MTRPRATGVAPSETTDTDADARETTDADVDVPRPTVVLDTNALMMPVECGVRVFDELDRLFGSVDALDLVVPRPVVAELDALSAGAGEAATAASVGADLVSRCRVVGTEASYADDAVVEAATPDDYVVTNDRPLRERLLERGVRVIGLRGRDTLQVTEP